MAGIHRAKLCRPSARAQGETGPTRTSVRPKVACKDRSPKANPARLSGERQEKEGQSDQWRPAKELALQGSSAAYAGLDRCGEQAAQGQPARRSRCRLESESALCWIRRSDCLVPPGPMAPPEPRPTMGDRASEQELFPPRQSPAPKRTR